MEAIGRYLIFISRLFKRRESFKTYLHRTIDECVNLGQNSLFLVAIVSVFMGAVTTIQTAFNLLSPFIPKYVISFIVREMTLLELSPTVIAIVFAGKVGSSIAGEIGTMKITEQVDALEIMGINSVSYLVLPKIIGAIFMYPILVIFSIFLTLLGGYVAGTLTGVITDIEYISGIRYQFDEFYIMFALLKAFVFGFLISSISAYKGFQTKGGALEVGKSSTAAVTSSCIAILLADYLLAEFLMG